MPRRQNQCACGSPPSHSALCCVDTFAWCLCGLSIKCPKQKRKSDDFRSKQSVSSKTAAMFKKRHGGKTSQLRPGTKRTMGRSSSAKSDASVTMRPVGGVTKAHRDLGKYTEHDFRRIHGISKSAMRTKLRREEFDMFAEAIGQKKAMDDDVFKNVYNKRRAPSIPKGTGEKDTPFTGTIKSKKDIKEKTLTPEKVQDDSQNLTPNYLQKNQKNTLI